MSSTPKTFLVCHGAWSAGWAWKKMHPLMQAAGHRLVTPTYTGLGERVHLANPSIDLETHIEDMLNVIKYRGPARHRADRPQLWRHGRDRRRRPRPRSQSAQLIYLDAFVPEDGQSLLDLNEADAASACSDWRKSRRRLARAAEPDARRIPRPPISTG